MDCTRSEIKQTTVNQKHFNHIYNIRGIAHNYVKIFKKLILVPQNQFTHIYSHYHIYPAIQEEFHYGYEMRIEKLSRGSLFGATRLVTSNISFRSPNIYFEISNH